MFHEHYLIYFSDTLLLPFNQMSKLKLREAQITWQGSDKLNQATVTSSHSEVLCHAELTWISLQRAYLYVQHRNPNKMERL